MRTSEASKSGSRAKRIAGVLGVPSRSDLGEGRVGIATLDTCDVRTPRGQRGRHVRTEWQRKPGTTRGSPRRSRTAKASRISRPAVKSRCAGEWGGWGRLSNDGPGQHNPDPSEGPWGGGRPTLQGGASAGQRPGAVRDNRPNPEVHEGRRQTGRQQAHAGSRLKPLTSGKAPPDRPAFQPYWGKPAVRNERGDRGNVGSIRSPVRASILPNREAYLRKAYLRGANLLGICVPFSEPMFLRTGRTSSSGPREPRRSRRGCGRCRTPARLGCREPVRRCCSPQRRCQAQAR